MDTLPENQAIIGGFNHRPGKVRDSNANSRQNHVTPRGVSSRLSAATARGTSDSDFAAGLDTLQELASCLAKQQNAKAGIPSTGTTPTTVNEEEVEDAEAFDSGPIEYGAIRPVLMRTASLSCTGGSHKEHFEEFLVTGTTITFTVLLPGCCGRVLEDNTPCTRKTATDTPGLFCGECESSILDPPEGGIEQLERAGISQVKRAVVVKDDGIAINVISYDRTLLVCEIMNNLKSPTGSSPEDIGQQHRACVRKLMKAIATNDGLYLPGAPTIVVDGDDSDEDESAEEGSTSKPHALPTLAPTLPTNEHLPASDTTARLQLQNLELRLLRAEAENSKLREDQSKRSAPDQTLPLADPEALAAIIASQAHLNAWQESLQKEQ